jgi:hypothetical protein
MAAGGYAAPAIGHTRWRRQQQLGGAASRGEHAAAVERKAGGRHGREEGVREPRRSRSRSGCMSFFCLQ